MPLAELGERVLQFHIHELGSDVVQMTPHSDSVTFRVRSRLLPRSALLIAAFGGISLLISSWLAGNFSRAPRRELLAVAASLLTVAVLIWLARPFFSRRTTVTVARSGFSVVRPNGVQGFCPWSRILEVELRTNAREETALWVHTGFGNGIDLPLDCARDPKFLALVQTYGSSTNPLAVYLRTRMLA
jgi:hypothetical protein